MKKYVLGIDQSTQGTKGIIFDGSGKIIARTDLAHDQIINEKGWVEHNPDQIMKNVIQVVKNVVEKAGIDKEEILTLGISNQRETAWIELGLQTIHESTARYIRRGYPLCVFDDAVKRLRKENIEVIVHTILGLPGENTADILETMKYLNHMDIQGIKLQLLHVLRGTDLAADYEKGLFQTYERDEYISLLINCLEHLRPDMVIHRITGDGPKDLLIAPLWASRKREVLNMLHHRMKEEQSYQGRLFSH